MTIISSDLAEISLEHADGTGFERFFHDFYSALEGPNFVPLGGYHDGGADGMIVDCSVNQEDERSFAQASVQADYRAKIRQTVKRLREFGRDPKSLLYATSRIVGPIDKVEDGLSDELGLRVRIRDRKYIVSHINDNDGTRAAFNNHLVRFVAFLKDPGTARIISRSAEVYHPEVFVFLRQEIDQRSGNASLIEAVTDSLILWALEGTDPDLERFMTKNEILEKILDVLPTAKAFIAGTMTHRLDALYSRKNTDGRQIRYYTDGDRWCLPFDTRVIVEQENIRDEALRVRVVNGFAQRCRDIFEDQFTDEEIDSISKLCMRAVEFTFQKEGMKFSTYILSEDEVSEYPEISDRVDDAFAELDMTNLNEAQSKDACFTILRKCLYYSSEEERILFNKMSRTYSLLFALKTEPRIVEYFQAMTGDFYLYVGTDILVRALSEIYLREEDQMTTNLLKMLADAGATLVLAEPVLNEINSHLKVTSDDYYADFYEVEKYMTFEHARNAERILIRSYYYAKFTPATERQPRHWKDFIQQFCNPEKVGTSSTMEEVRGYFQNRFRMAYVDSREMSEPVNQLHVHRLTKKIIERTNKGHLLAEHDALMVQTVYEKRREHGEHATATHFGYRTWWLTQETAIRQATKELVREKAAPYLMRPEFLINFISLAPSMSEVRRIYDSIFPTLLGIKLSGRMKETVYKEMLKQVVELNRVDEARAKSMMATMADELKAYEFRAFQKDAKNVESER